MIPIRDTIKSRTIPILVFIILFLNAFGFLLEISSKNIESLIMTFGFVPQNFFFNSVSNDPVGKFLPLLTSLFLHGGFLHFFGNMLFLWVFADNVEDRLGKIKFILLYFGSGIIASLSQGVMMIHSKIPMIGASGAIAGILGAYLILFPHSRIVTFIPVFIFPLFIEIPAPFFLLYWFLMQFLNGALAVSNMEWANTAWWAHIGGFLCGVFFALIFGKGNRRNY